MASAAEQMAANLSWGALGKATDLRQRIFFTLGLLMVYRLGTYIPVPGIDGQALRDFMADAGAGLGGNRAKQHRRILPPHHLPDIIKQVRTLDFHKGLLCGLLA